MRIIAIQQSVGAHCLGTIGMDVNEPGWASFRIMDGDFPPSTTLSISLIFSAKNDLHVFETLQSIIRTMLSVWLFS